LHISRIDSERRVDRVEDYLTQGQRIKVRLREIDDKGKLSLELVDPIEPSEEVKNRPSGGDRRDDRGDDRGRDRDRGGRGDRDRGGRDTRDRGPRESRPPERPAHERGSQGSDAGGDRRRPARSFDEAFEEIDPK
jgi:polyribonucleotide nucleotidyltransferase